MGKLWTKQKPEAPSAGMGYRVAGVLAQGDRYRVASAPRFCSQSSIVIRQ